jgi:hypothetical protein
MFGKTGFGRQGKELIGWEWSGCTKDNAARAFQDIYRKGEHHG